MNDPATILLVLLIPGFIALYFGGFAKLMMLAEERTEARQWSRLESWVPEESRESAKLLVGPAPRIQCVEWTNDGITFCAYTTTINSEYSSTECDVVVAETLSNSPSRARIERIMENTTRPQEVGRVSVGDSEIVVTVKRGGDRGESVRLIADWLADVLHDRTRPLP